MPARILCARARLPEMAAATAAMAISMVRGEQPQQHRVEFATRLAIRASTGAPKA